MSKIEWTEKTWNPVTGCVKISEGCKNCYAERMAKRLKAMGLKKYRNGFDVTMHPDSLNDPLKWKKPCMVFVCSMSDIFQCYDEDGNPKVERDFVLKIFNVIKNCPQHTFQILTKRAFTDWFYYYYLPKNVWLGITIENNNEIDRLYYLKQSKAKLKFISFEPLLGPVDVDLTGIDWVIVGCESGPGARPMKIEWVRSIRDQCIQKDIPFFLKQLNFVGKKKNRVLDGHEWNEFPER